MKITIINTLTNKLVSMELDISLAQYERWKDGEHVQNAMPHLKPCEREFLITGITPKEWEERFEGCTQKCKPCKYNVKQLTEEEDE